MSRSILAKMGYRPDAPAMVYGLPETLAPLFATLRIEEKAPPVWIVAFALNQQAIANIASEAIPAYRRSGHLWICYPKLSGARRSDISRDVGWEPVAALGLFGVTQISIDADWSALRFRFRDEIPNFTRNLGDR